ncbi:MAG: hypothetical protein WD767_20495 [Alphaproteobacteria bacterium]
MPDLSPYADILASIRAEWNQAERTIKDAELAINEPIQPSILELRYAGRRLIEALEKLATGGEQEDICKLLNDAYFNCLRARHDAIDAASAGFIITINSVPEYLGYDPVLKAFPDFPELLLKLTKLSDLIADSRSDRENRDKIYHSIEQGEFPKILELYKKFKSSEPLMEKLAGQQRSTTRRNDIFGWGGIIIGVVGLGVGIYSLGWNWIH